MTNVEAVEKVSKDNLVRNIIMRITKNGKTAKDPSTLDDLEQDIYLSLLQDEKFPKIVEEGHANFYIARIVCNNIMSSSSRYYRAYLWFRNKTVEITDWNVGDKS